MRMIEIRVCNVFTTSGIPCARTRDPTTSEPDTVRDVNKNSNIRTSLILMVFFDDQWLILISCCAVRDLLSSILLDVRTLWETVLVYHGSTNAVLRKTREIYSIS